MEEEHLHQLHIVFARLWEHNLKLKPTKCEFFKNEINYFGSSCIKEDVQSIKENLKTVAEFAPPQTST